MCDPAPRARCAAGGRQFVSVGACAWSECSRAGGQFFPLANTRRGEGQPNGHGLAKLVRDALL